MHTVENSGGGEGGCVRGGGVLNYFQNYGGGRGSIRFGVHFVFNLMFIRLFFLKICLTGSIVIPLIPLFASMLQRKGLE
jgi:hypothetical protein